MTMVVASRSGHWVINNGRAPHTYSVVIAALSSGIFGFGYAEVAPTSQIIKMEKAVENIIPPLNLLMTNSMGGITTRFP